jgi:gluconate/galactonate dehydratase
LKISDVESFQLGEAVPGGATWAGNSIVVRVTTSNGLVGYGEAVPTLRVQPVLKSIDEVSRVYKGKDPLDFEANMHEWRKHDFYLPFSFESTTALSAVDIACWDIAGKSFGAPIHQLIGGMTRAKVKHYANGWYADCVTPEQFGREAKKFHRMGYTALKFDPFGPYYDYIDEAGLKTAYERVRAVRDATGGKVALLIEHHGRFNPNSAIMIARRLQELDPLFMEEPVHPENFLGLKKYRDATDVRVAIGERILSAGQALHAMEEGLFDFLQIDITNIGGVTMAKKVSATAEAFGIEMAFHNAFGPIQNAVTIQVDAAIPNFLIQESFYDIFPAWKRKLVRDGTKVVGGHTAVSKRPGIGVEVDERVLEEYRAEGQEPFNPEEPVWAVRGTWKSPGSKVE